MPYIEIQILHSPRQKETLSFPIDNETLDLSGLDIIEVDLNEAARMPHLRTLNLSHNRLEGIELSEFICSPNGETLESIDISHNHIHAVNLNPLRRCPGIRKVNLSDNQLEELDLSPLEQAHLIESIDVSHNWIRAVDTTPLSNKPQLRHVILNENPIASLDLTFLHTSPNLDTLLVDWTKIEMLDLSPFASTPNIRVLGISQNKVRDLDLYPLVKCERLEQVNISGIDSTTIDLWPLFGLPFLKEAHISPRISIDSFPFSSAVWPLGLESIRSRISTSAQREEWRAHEFGVVRARFREIHAKLNNLARYHLRISFLEIMKLEHLQGYDGSLLDHIDDIDAESSFEDARAVLMERLSDALVKQVKQGGSTHFIDLSLADRFPSIALLSPTIIEARRKELECAHIVKKDEYYDTTLLWYTVYGCEVLNALGIGLSTDLNGLERIELELKRTGIDALNIRDYGSDWKPPHLSEEMQAYLRFLAVRCSQ